VTGVDFPQVGEDETLKNGDQPEKGEKKTKDWNVLPRGLGQNPSKKKQSRKEGERDAVGGKGGRSKLKGRRSQNKRGV